MAGGCGLSDMCEYETDKVVRIRSVKYGTLKWAIHLVVVLYVGFVLVTDKRYQKQDSVISSIHTKVKGVVEADNRIWDTAEYTLPMQGVNSFFVITNIIRTEKQVQGVCAEYPSPRTICSTDKVCKKGHAAPQSNATFCEFLSRDFITGYPEMQNHSQASIRNRSLAKPSERSARTAVEREGLKEAADRFLSALWIPGRTLPGKGIQTGRCVNYNSTLRTCEVSAWCPVESERNAPEPAVLNSAENFTVLIKNNIHFPAFDHTVKNIVPGFNVSCTFNRFTAPQCPIFRLGDIFQATRENFSEVAIQGGIMGIEINWNCNLDKWAYHCRPRYGFRRLDDKKATEALYPGYNFRFAKYFKLPDGREERMLIKAYGIRFDVLVFGKGGKFNFFEVVVYIGSALSYFGLAVLVIDFLITSYVYPCCKGSVVKKYYLGKKSESVIGPRSAVMYVSFVDSEHILLVDCVLRSSLQKAKGQIVEMQQSGRSLRDVQLPVLVSQNPEELPLLNRSGKSDPESVPWCVCGRCYSMAKLKEQLCCRRSKGPCVTAAPLFARLVLSRPTLEFILLYKEPLLDVHSADINDKLRHCAYAQYIHWRFGSGEIESYAVIPSCCKQTIREMYPSKDGKYSGF